MRILVLSFYYSPDLSAGSFRATALVNHLKSLNASVLIDVITTLPNRYSSYRVPADEFEVMDNVSITRLPISSHNSGMTDQARAFTQYARGVHRLTKSSDYALVFATSGRLLTAVLGAHVSRARGAPLYLDIRDIFTETLSGVIRRWMVPLVWYPLQLLENYTFNTALKINLVSPGFRDYFANRFPNVKYDFYTNGIDDTFLGFSEATATRPQSTDRRHLCVYAGNIGESQGLHEILPELARRTEDDFEFVIIGDGGRRRQLEEQLQEFGVRNVELIKPVPREDLLDHYRRADVLFLHLNQMPAYERVLPSKLFELAATGKPILAGVAGFCARFITEQISNAAVFPPCDRGAAVAALRSLSLRDEPRSQFVDSYRRDRIVEGMCESILSLVRT